MTARETAIGIYALEEGRRIDLDHPDDQRWLERMTRMVRRARQAQDWARCIVTTRKGTRCTRRATHGC